VLFHAESLDVENAEVCIRPDASSAGGSIVVIRSGLIVGFHADAALVASAEHLVGTGVGFLRGFPEQRDAARGIGRDSLAVDEAIAEGDLPRGLALIRGDLEELRGLLEVLL